MKWWVDSKFLVACVIAGFVSGYCIATSWGAATDKSFWDVASSLGTVAAVVVALGIAMSQGVAARDREKAHAILVAARLSGTFQAVASSVREIRVVLMLTKDPDSADSFEKFKAKILATVDVDTTELIPLLPLPNKCAHRMAQALGLIGMMRVDATNIQNGDRWVNLFDSQREEFWGRWQASTDSARRLIEAARADFSNAASGGDPAAGSNGK